MPNSQKAQIIIVLLKHLNDCMTIGQLNKCIISVILNNNNKNERNDIDHKALTLMIFKNDIQGA